MKFGQPFEILIGRNVCAQVTIEHKRVMITCLIYQSSEIAEGQPLFCTLGYEALRRSYK